jgi:hypothetical protein
MSELPPRFKIYHNISEDYYFIKERFWLFWYKTISESVGYDTDKIRTFSSLDYAEAYIGFVLEYEKQSKIPDEIKLVKNYD